MKRVKTAHDKGVVSTDLLDLQIDFVKKYKNLKGQYYCPFVGCDWTHRFDQQKIVEHLQTHKKI